MLVDAHNHLQDGQFKGRLEELARDLERAGISHCIVNGTQETDWESVTELCAKHPSALSPAYGLHPWYLNSRTEKWSSSLERMLDDDPRASVGECGLDKWMKNHDLPLQRAILIEHLRIATSRNLAITIHCLQAWGSLLDILQSHPLPSRGFLLHAYGGPPEMIAELAKLGAYFSFNGYFFNVGKEDRLKSFHLVPKDRLLIETDAPAMRPPESCQALAGMTNHPINLPLVAQALAREFQISEQELTHLCRDNAQRLWPNISIT